MKTSTAAKLRASLCLALCALTTAAPRAHLAQEKLTAASAQPAPTSRIDFAELERVALEELKETKTPGAAIAVVSGDRVLLVKGFGVANVETGEAVTPDTLFRMGSTTKMLTALALLNLSEAGKMRFDRPVGDYAKGLDPKIAQLTAHQLLTHTAGLRDDGAGDGPVEDASLAARVRSWKEDFFFAGPSKIHSYSSPGYWLAGFVAEELTGKPYPDAMDELVFKPLGMRRTTLRPLVAMTYTLAQGHVPGGESGKMIVVRPHPENASARPGGSAFSTANDLARFALALVNNGWLDGKQVVPAETLKTLSTPHAKFPGDETGTAGYGYGLLSFDERGVRLAQHGGARKGYGSSITFVPEHRVAVVALANSSGVMMRKTTEKALELLLSLKPRETEKPKPAQMLAAGEAAKYAGSYANGPQVWEVSARDGKLFLKEEGAEKALTKIGEHRFSIGEPVEGEIFFVAEPDGRVEHLSVGLYAARRVKAAK